MGTSCHVCVEARIDGVWTYLTYFWLGKKDYQTYNQLGFNPNEGGEGAAPPEWTVVSRWHFVQCGGRCPATMGLDAFRKVAEQRRLESPRRFDLRPGSLTPLREWLESEVVEDPPGWSVSWFLGDWPHTDAVDKLGSEIRLCIWFS